MNICYKFSHGSVFLFSWVDTQEWNRWVTCTLCLAFGSAAQLFPTVAAPCYIPNTPHSYLLPCCSPKILPIAAATEVLLKTQSSHSTLSKAALRLLTLLRDKCQTLLSAHQALLNLWASRRPPVVAISILLHHVFASTWLKS